MASDDFVDAVVDGQVYRGANGSIDITGVDDVEIVIKTDGREIWINAPDLRVRICGIRGEVFVTDMRVST
jgi:hypothetical protein